MTHEGISRNRLEERLILRSWESKEFRRSLLEDPRITVARELSLMAGRQMDLPAEMKIHIHEEMPGDLHFVLPYRRDDLAEDDESLLVGWRKLLR